MKGAIRVFMVGAIVALAHVTEPSGALAGPQARDPVIERLVSMLEQLDCVASAVELQWAIDIAPRLLAASNPFDSIVIDDETARAFPEADAVDRLRIKLIMFLAVQGDVVGALRLLQAVTERNLREFHHLLIESLDELSKARSRVIRNFARAKPPCAHDRDDPAGTARAQDRQSKYEQFVQVTTQLVDQLKPTEQELIDLLDQVQAEAEWRWQELHQLGFVEVGPKDPVDY